MKEVTKSYNPFKMWGSWVVFIMVIILYLFFPFAITVTQGFGVGKIGQEVWCGSFEKCAFEHALGNLGQRFSGGWTSDMNPMPQYSSTSLASFFYGAVGFLLGWGIHSLVRRYKK